MKYLDYNETIPKVEISSPIFHNYHKCEVKQNFQFIRDGQKWNQNNKDKIVSIKYKDYRKYDIKVQKKLYS